MALQGAAFTSGNLLISYNETLYEYTTGGTQVQAIPIGANPSESNRAVALDLAGNAVIFDGTFSPVLVVYDPVLNSSSTYSETNWSVSNNLTHGGIAVYGNLIYATDMNTSGKVESGLLRFDSGNSYASTRFFDGTDYVSVTMEQDGVLYGLQGDYTTLDKYRPSTLASLGQVTLAQEVRKLGIGPSGDFFGVSFSGVIYRFNSSGSEVDSLNLGGTCSSLAVRGDGTIAVAFNSSTIAMTTEALGTPATFSAPSSASSPFLHFVSTPLPAELDAFNVE